MQLVIFEDAGFSNLLPLVYSRATFNLRCGFDNLLDKIETVFGQTAAALFVRESIAPAIAERQGRPVNTLPGGDSQLWINGRLFVRERFEMPPNTAAWKGDTLLAASIDAATAARLTTDTLLDPAKLKVALAGCQTFDLPDTAGLLIDYPWNLIHANEVEIIRQCYEFNRQTDRAVESNTGSVHSAAHLLNPEAIHVGTGITIMPGAVLDAENGPIYIGKNVHVGSHVTITGPCFVGDDCRIKPGASLSCVSLGRHCRVGGEVSCTIFHGYANKQHEGFLGHSYVGEWANLGAATVTSNLKNTYGSVRVPVNGRLIDSGERFVGTIFGDHVKTGIATALPTGCVIGYGSNVFVSGYAPKFVPSFGWLTDEGVEGNDPQRALAVAHTVVARRDREYTAVEDALFLSIVEESQRWEESNR